MPVVRYLALGDSYTIGESVDESERWSLQLASMIQTSPQIASQFGGTEGGGVEVTIIARTGWTTDELWDGIQAQEVNPPYDLVSLLIGVNNQYRGLDIEEYRKSFVFLLNKSIEYVGGDADRVIVLSIPDWGVTPFAGDRDSKKIADEINQYNAVNRALHRHHTHLARSRERSSLDRQRRLASLRQNVRRMGEARVAGCVGDTDKVNR